MLEDNRSSAPPASDVEDRSAPQAASESSRERPAVWRRRLSVGAVSGAVSTVVMSVPMLASTATGLSPMPRPVPAALVVHALGSVPRPAVLVMAAIAHLAYGAAAGALFAVTIRRPRLWHTIAYALALWAFMGLAWLPWLGWGLFGTGITPKIAAATLVLHVVYGVSLGLLLRRSMLSGTRRDGRGD